MAHTPFKIRQQQLASARQILLGKANYAYLSQRLLQPLGFKEIPLLNHQPVFAATSTGDILFNYFDTQQQIIDYQVKRLNPTSLQGKNRKNKYINPTAKEIQPYLVAPLLFNIQSPTQYLIEGQIKALIATKQFRLPFIGISGIEAGIGQKKRKEDFWNDDDNFSFSSLLIKHLEEVKATEVVFIHDADVFANIDKPHRAASFSRAIEKYALLKNSVPLLTSLWYGHIHPRYSQVAKGLDDLLALYPSETNTIQQELQNKVSGGYFVFYDLFNTHKINCLQYQLGKSIHQPLPTINYTLKQPKIGQDKQAIGLLLEYSTSPNHKFLQVVAGTGDGKTTAFLQKIVPSLCEKYGKVLFTVPLVSLAEQLYAQLSQQTNNPNFPTSYLVTGTTEIADLLAAHTAKFIVATYDSVRKLTDWIDEQTVLVIDEVHCLQDCQNYRKNAIDNLLQYFPLLPKIIGLTGTPLNVTGFTTLQFHNPHTPTIQVVPVTLSPQTTYQTYLLQLLPELLSKKNHLVVLKVDDSELLSTIGEYLVQANILPASAICKLYNYELDKELYQELIQNSQLPSTIQLILTTSKIEMGVSIHTDKKVCQVLVNEKNVRDWVQQVNRFRTYIGQMTIYNLRKQSPISQSWLKMQVQRKICLQHLQQKAKEYIHEVQDEVLSELAIRQTDMKPFVVESQQLYLNDFAIHWHIENLPNLIPTADGFYAKLAIEYPQFHIHQVSEIVDLETIASPLLTQVNETKQATKIAQQQAFNHLQNKVTLRGVLEYVYVCTQNLQVKNALQKNFHFRPSTHNALAIKEILQEHPTAYGKYADKWVMYFLKIKACCSLGDEEIANLLNQQPLTNYNVGKLIKTLQTQLLCEVGKLVTENLPVAKSITYQYQMIQRDKAVITELQQKYPRLTLTLIRKALNHQKGYGHRNKLLGSNAECKSYLQTIYQIIERASTITIQTEKSLENWCEQWGVTYDKIYQYLINSVVPQTRKLLLNQKDLSFESGEDVNVYHYTADLPF